MPTEYTKEQKDKYCAGFKKCTLTLPEYAEKMKIRAEDLKRWLKEYKETLPYGATDFRKQIVSLCNMVKTEYNMNPYQKVAFIFCNRKKNSIKVLCYDKTGFVLAQKTLLNVDKYKFKWPKNEKELGQITHEQLSWLLSGLQIYPKSYFKDIEIENDKVVI